MLETEELMKTVNTSAITLAAEHAIQESITSQYTNATTWKKRMLQRLQTENAKSTATAVYNKVKPLEIINLDTDIESDSSDVVMITPTVTIEDSTDEEETTNENVANNVSVILEGYEEDPLNITSPKTSSKQEGIQNNSVGRDYLMALNAYKIDSDLVNNVYTTSSDEAEYINYTSHKAKRLRKRRYPRSNKRFYPSYYNSAYSTDDDIDDLI